MSTWQTPCTRKEVLRKMHLQIAIRLFNLKLFFFLNSYLNKQIKLDYNLIESGMENMKVTIDKKPNYIEMIRFNPEAVEFLIEIE